MKTWHLSPLDRRPTAEARPSIGPSRRRGLSIVVGCLLVLSFPGATAADWLVTREGQSIETQGPWKTKGRMVVFTNTAGLLLSMRLSEVDLEASETLTRHRRQQAEAATEPSAPEAAEDTREPVLVLTNESVGAGQDGAEGAEALVQRLRNAHRFQDVGLAMGLVNTQDSPAGILDFMRQQFEWLMEQRIQDIQLVEVPVEEDLAQVQDGEAYEPNLEVTHRMTIDLVPDPDQDTSTLTLLVGLRLGSYYIAAARPSEIGP